MQTFARVYQMQDLIEMLDRNKIAGSVVETGSWKGGTGAFMATFGRTTWLFDSFEGLPEMSEKDKELVEAKKLDYNKITGYISVDEKFAQDISKKLRCEPKIIKGWFKNSLPKYKSEIGSIALLRLDGDTYSSTKEALEILYENIVIGGFVVIDDYSDFEGCREAVYEFFINKKIYPELIQYPNGRIYFRKV